MMTRRLATAACALLLTALPFAWAQQGQQPPTPPPPVEQQAPAVTVTVRLVKLLTTVTDRRHTFVTDLDKTDFRVLEQGKAQPITFFSRETDLPLRIGVLLDTSNSIRERLRFEKEAAQDFLYKVIRRHKDMAFLMTFDNEPEVIQDFTEDLDALSQAIDRQRAGGGTALRDAVVEASEKLAYAPLPTEGAPEVRRILVVISDGVDNLSDRTTETAIESALRNEICIYTISTSTDWLALDQGAPVKVHKEPGDQLLEQLADETGGRVFFPYKVDDLAQSFLDIDTELRSQYSIGFQPVNYVANGKFHPIKVEVNRKGLTVRTRSGYYAVPSPNETKKPAAGAQDN